MYCLYVYCLVRVCNPCHSVPNSSFSHLLLCSYMLAFQNWVWCGTRLKYLLPMWENPHVQPNSSATHKRTRCWKTTPKGIAPSQTWSGWEWRKWRWARERVCSRWQLVDKGTSSKGSGGYKLEFHVLYDQKVMSCYVICIIPCIPCPLCKSILNGLHLHMWKEKLKYVLLYM